MEYPSSVEATMNPVQPHSADPGDDPLKTHGSLPAPSTRDGSAAFQTGRDRPTVGWTHLAPGTRPLPEYELVERLGKGGFGEVWKAIGPGGVEMALKFLNLNEKLSDIELRALDLLKGIRHPNLVAIAGIWKTDDVLILAMELGANTLHDRLKETGKQGLPFPESLEYFAEAARGLDYLASLNIVHRDIKPKNLLLVGGGVKIADFGLAKLLEKTVATSSGSMTPAYAAPEFFKGEVHLRSDLYSLAVSWCEIRGGRLPFAGNFAELMAGHLQGAPDLTMLPEEEREVVARALDKDPEKRWASCKEFVEALRRLHADTGAGSLVGVHAPPDLVLGRNVAGRGRLWAALASAAVLLALALYLFLSPREDPLVRLRREEIRRQVDFLKKRPPEILRAHAAGYQEVDTLETPSYEGFQLLADERIVDLRGWQEVPLDNLHELRSPVTMTTRRKFRRIGRDDSLAFLSHTSGHDLFQTSTPFPFQVFGRRGDVFIGAERMKSRLLRIDVSKVPVGQEFEVRQVATYWNSLQTEQEQWFGAMGYEGAFKISMLLLFPEEKPARSYELRVAPTNREAPVLYQGPRIVLEGEDGTWLFWEIPNPQASKVYRVDWKW